MTQKLPMQVHILSRGMAYTGLLLLKYVPLKVVDSILVMLSKLWYGDLTKYGIRRPEEGPFTLKVKYGKYPVIDVGTHQKIKSGHIQVHFFINIFLQSNFISAYTVDFLF